MKPNYFMQGFLFIFGLGSLPFESEVKPKDKIAEYWDKTSNIIHKIFNEQAHKTK